MSWFESIEKDNLLVCDDNLKALREIPDESINLIYLDPPFFSGRNYNVVWGDDGEVRSFQDRWAGGSEKTGMEIYIAWMQERIVEMHRVLKDTGSFYLHCDWHASHYLKVMCDRVFGYGNFRNEIVWKYKFGGRGKNAFGKKHDVILFYARSENCQFNEESVRVPHEPGSLEQNYRYTDENGRRYRKGTWKSGKEYCYYADEGRSCDDVWDDVGSLHQADKERVGYPTQKPLALLERIIKASSNEGDIVLDPFVGGGTTPIAAANLKRRYIGIDESVAAIRVADERIKNHFGMFEDQHALIVNFPLDFDDLDNMDPYEFEGFMVTQFGGTPNKRRRGDMGLDGHREGTPIQVKQSERIGRNVVDNFRAAIQRAKKKEGYILAWSFGTGARNEAARLKNEEDILIHLVEVGSFLKVNHRPLVEITKMAKDGKNVEVVAEAKDQDKDNIVLWNWYIDGELGCTDVVCQRDRKSQERPETSKITFKYTGPVKVRVIATDAVGGTGESRKRIGLDNAYRSPSVSRTI